MASRSSPLIRTSYKSTRGLTNVTFEDALSAGYAPDGGLFVPEQLGKITPELLLQWKGLTFQELAFTILSSFFIGEEEITTPELRKIINASFELFEDKTIIPCVKVGDVTVAELFHGPTLSFKDFGQQMLCRLLNFFCERKRQHIAIVVATTGDTGPAAITAVAPSRWLSIVCGFPQGQVSKLQELQMTTLDSPNVVVYQWEGGGDDMDAPIKRLILESSKPKGPGGGMPAVKMCAVNSINVGRIAAQVCHFVWCYLQVSSIDNIRSGRAVRFAIPTGAVGNIMAGILAREMGMPATFVAGVNANDIMDRVVQTGDYVIQAMQRTLSEAINIQCPYNFERILFYLSGQDAGFVRHWYGELARTNGNHLPYGMHQKLRMFVQTAKIDDDVMLKTMQTYWQKHGYVCDPHTAVALAAVVQVDSLASRPLASSASVTLEPSSSFSSSPSPSPSPSSSSSKGPVTVVLSTAHPAKFEEALRAGLGDAFWRENYAVDATNPLKRGKRMPALAAQLYSKAVVGGRTVFPQGSDFTARLTQLVQEEVLAPMAAKVKLRGKL